MTETPLPNYIGVASNEDGASFPGVSFGDYRMLASVALSVFAGESNESTYFMGIYKLPKAGGGVDIFTANKCLTIRVNSAAKQISLQCVDLDSVENPLHIFKATNSRQLASVRSDGTKGA